MLLTARQAADQLGDQARHALCLCQPRQAALGRCPGHAAAPLSGRRRRGIARRRCCPARRRSRGADAGDRLVDLPDRERTASITAGRTRSRCRLPQRLEDVAALLWRADGALPSTDAIEPSVSERAAAAVSGLIERCQIRLATLADVDLPALDLTRAGVIRTGWRILHELAACVAPIAARAGTYPPPARRGLAAERGRRRHSSGAASC